MALKTGKLNIQKLLPGLMALVTAAVLLVCLLMIMDATRPEPVDEETTTAAPTVAANPYGPEDFTYDGEYLTCTAGESILGIDVSAHQGSIDWEAVKAAGVEFVMLRIGYRGYELGALNTDEMAQENYNGAKAAGLKVGAYFFSQAITEQEAIAEAEYAMNIMRGWELDMPVVYDWEYISSEARTANVDARLLTDCTIAFCETVERAGYAPMVYFNVSQATHRLYLEELTEYPFWLAMYTDTMDFPYRVEMWQYTCTGQVPGVQTDVDINLLLPQ